MPDDENVFYVDRVNRYPRKFIKPAARKYGVYWCHLFAGENTSEDALHEFAASIGLKRNWFQRNRRLNHYDLTPAKRVEAVSAGAKELTGNDLIAFMSRRTRGRGKDS